ncbi:D-alanyl-D-alanine dipeptidase [Rickettsiales bacterium]|nr:D-alanyl-D-alanine dipeptidase [Rickettsiales bacterium]
MKNLIPIIQENFDIILDSRYFSKNNITNDFIYDKEYNFLHEEAANKLQIAIKLAKDKGYKIKIFDSYRPIKFQQYLYDKFPGDYVSNPATGAVPHCRAIAIDLTLIDQNGEELEMGTPFDDFSPKAHHGSSQISIKAQKNRLILLSIMISSGWDFYSKEWWHYQLFNPRNYPII